MGARHRLESTLVGVAGEYDVAGELSVHGYLAGVLGQMRAVLEEQERTVRRRQITDDGAREVITNWGAKLLEY